MIKAYFSVGKLVTKLSLEEQFYLAKEAGFDGIDYILSIPDLFAGCKQISNLSKKYTIPVKGIHIPLLMVPYAPSIGYKKLYQAISFFPDCEIFNVHLSSFITPIQRNNKQIKKFLELNENKNLTISFESNPKSRLVSYYPKETFVPEIFANYCIKENLSINFDLSHIATFNYNINNFYDKYNKYIQLIHVSDFDGYTQHLALGKGKLPLQKLFSNLKQTSYKGKIIFEIYKFSKNISERQRLKEIKESLNFFRETVH